MSFSWSLMGLVLFNICVSNMNSGIKFNLSKFDKDTKLRGAVNILDGIDAIHMDLDRLERWAHVTLFKFNTAKHKVLGECQEKIQGGQRLDWEQPSLRGKGLGGIEQGAQQVSAMCTCRQKAKCVLDYIQALWTAGWGREFSLHRTLVRSHVEFCVHTWRPPA